LRKKRNVITADIYQIAEITNSKTIGAIGVMTKITKIVNRTNNMDNYELNNKKRELQIRVGQAINLAEDGWVRWIIGPGADRSRIEQQEFLNGLVDDWFKIINETQKRYHDKYFPTPKPKLSKAERRDKTYEVRDNVDLDSRPHVDTE